MRDITMTVVSSTCRFVVFGGNEFIHIYYRKTRFFLRRIIQNTTDVLIYTTENTVRMNRAADVCIPEGEKMNPAARKSSVTTQTVGTAKYGFDQNEKMRGIK